MKEASVIFDGTARMGEALAIVIRFVQEDFKPTQRLIQLEVLAKALKGVELAQRLMSCLAVKYNFVHWRNQGWGFNEWGFLATTQVFLLQPV